MADSGFQTWQLVVIFGSIVVMLLALGGFVYCADRAAKRSNEEQAALREELNSTHDPADKRRPEVAIQVADSGYIVCPKCAFENFATAKSCAICKTLLVVVSTPSK